tara:strand:- start:2802 stop:3662 length:861 start_codon:yes stop_codon:yes gene_type:complete
MIQDYLTECSKKIYSNFKKKISSKSKISQAMLYTLLAPSKCIRGSLVFASASLLSHLKEPSIINIASAIEALHSYSLIHDDLPSMDNDDIRRGISSNHIMHGEATAILAGDALHSFAFNIISEDEHISSDQKVEIIRLLTDACGFDGMILGQQMDLDAEKNETDDVTKIHKLKTAKLIEASIVSPHTVGSLRNTLEPIGESIGLAFQIMDDVLEVTKTSEELGKKNNSDKKNSKLTYVKKFGLDKSVQDASNLINDAIKSINKIDIENSKKENLKGISTYILERNK